ncbi:parallel beta-helix repeat protein [Blastomonas natatoria]|uniref:Parallel beta-helix repeat protein n=1 Tax=Blastomonas natatoria TaxID=34015 RepID=A0A2V3V4J2_9SPHN|nr:parallel beta-helix domain-containing protein [Blastomonas natatoria]PXW75861.1 parallel beta-helix repeat protein [Blastomonas natatoria]
MKRNFAVSGSLLLTALAMPASAKDMAVAAGAGAQERLQEALILAEPGDVVTLGEGRFELTDGLSLDVAGVTVRGAGPDKSVLSFKGQLAAGEGLLVTSDNVVLRDFAVEDSKGDAIKSKGADNIVYHNIRVEWTGGPKETNGAYGIYPVESQNVLIDSVLVIGASDAGIYVGQSRNIIVRDSVARFNVAGIEIENSFDADVHDNVATKNTGGILVFDLPNLPQQGGHNVRVFDNLVVENDTPNFAPKGNIVASVPTGTGVMVMANRDIEIFDNVFDGNGSSNIMIIGYRQKFDDAKYQPMVRNVRISDNAHGKTGFAPRFDGGEMLAAAFGGTVPPIIWDGVGGADANVYSSDDVPVLNLGMTKSDQPIDTAQPALAKLAGDAAPKLPKIVMPEAMEAAIR